MPPSSDEERVVRRGTRITRRIPLTVISLDPKQPLAEATTTLVVNLQGCGVLLSRPLAVGTLVRLEVLLAAKTGVAARVANCISLGEFEKTWLVGLVLDQPGNIWGVQDPPDDWG